MADTTAGSEGAKSQEAQQEPTPRVPTARLVADIAFYGTDDGVGVEGRVEQELRRVLSASIGECAVTVTALGKAAELAEIRASGDALLVARAMVAGGWGRNEVIALRHARRMTVRGFGLHLGVSDRAVSKWERRTKPETPRGRSREVLSYSLDHAGVTVWLRFVTQLGPKSSASRLELVQKLTEEAKASDRRTPEEDAALRARVLESIKKLGASESKALWLALEIFTTLGIIDRKASGVLRRRARLAQTVEESAELRDMNLLQLEGMEQAADLRDVTQMFTILKKAGINQYRIARATGLSQSEVSEFIGGNRVAKNVDLLERICDGFGLPRATMGLGRVGEV